MAERKLKQQIDALWEQLRGIINYSYNRQRAAENHDEAEIADALRDFAENQSMNDALLSLLDREAASEVKHRNFVSGSYPISKTTSAKLLIMAAVVQGAGMLAMPSALSFLLLRKTAAEARVLGFLIRHDIPGDWLKEAAALDYSKIMNAA